MRLMLSFEQVSYSYPGASGLAIDNVSFAVSPGEHVVLLGSNGSGKSTLAQLSNGLLLPTRGKVLVDGLSTDDRTTIRKLRSQVGVVSQNPDNQIVSTTVLDEVAFGLENLGVERVFIAARVTGALEALGLSGFEERDPNSLSGGEKQRLIIAGLLAMEPGFLVLDEPMSMLDEVGQAEVYAAIGRLHADGHGILHITHDLRFARDADRALVLAGGRLVFDGRPGELLDDEERLVALGLKVCEEETPRVEFTCIRPLNFEQTSLYLEAVHYSYGKGTENARAVLCGLDLTIAPGSYTLISGRTGSGKSTLLRILAGLLAPTGGTARFSSGKAIVPGDVGMVFQHPESQLFAKTIEEEILFGPENLGLLSRRPNAKKNRVSAGADALRAGASADVQHAEVVADSQHAEAPADFQRVEVVSDALRAVGLDPASFSMRSPFTLSGGEMRRVAIASILSMRRGFLLLDEPTASLDAQGRAFVHSLIRSLVEAGVGVVVVSHDLEEFRPRAQRHLILKDGRLWHS